MKGIGELPTQMEVTEEDTSCVGPSAVQNGFPRVIRLLNVPSLWESYGDTTLCGKSVIFVNIKRRFGIFGRNKEVSTPMPSIAFREKNDISRAIHLLPIPSFQCLPS